MSKRDFLEELGFKKELEKEEQQFQQKEIDVKNKEFERNIRKFEGSHHIGNSMSWGFE